MIAAFSLKMPPAASSTPSVARTVSRVDAGIAGSGASSRPSTAGFDVTTASMPSFASVKISSNDLSIVSVRM
jgi:hypothetical protein